MLKSTAVQRFNIYVIKHQKTASFRCTVVLVSLMDVFRSLLIECKSRSVLRRYISTYPQGMKEIDLFCRKVGTSSSFRLESVFFGKFLRSVCRLFNLRTLLRTCSNTSGLDANSLTSAPARLTALALKKLTPHITGCKK